MPTEEQIRKKEEKSNLELTFISNKLSSIIEIRRNSFWQLIYISVVIVGVFINMIKSIAIIDFMMESVVPVL